jgi:membrane protease YdiL (CAAX protease family)
VPLSREPPGWEGRLGTPPDPPELPEAARPRWPAWYAPVALLASLAVLLFISLPTAPVYLLLLQGGDVGAVALLVALLFQDVALVGGALAFATIKRRPREWHFGLRATRFWPTVGWAALGFAVLLGLELSYIELLEVEESNVEEFAGETVLAQLAVCLAVIVVAPVSEEFFFRGFFYRALRSRLRVWSASLIDGVVFGALHFESLGTAVILPVIASFGVGVCLVYERTGSLFAVIAIHAAFNTVAMLGAGGSAAVPLVVGLAVISACALVPRRLGPRPSPFPVPA